MLQSPSASPPDSDPLLCFETEHEVSPESPEPVVEPRTSDDPPKGLTPPIQLSERVDSLERGLAAANAEVALLRSDVATLVRAVDDIRTRNRRPAAGSSTGPRPARRTASVVAGLVIAVVAAGWLWMSNRASAEPIAPASSEPTSQLPPTTDPAPATASAGDNAPGAAPSVSPDKTAVDTTTSSPVKQTTRPSSLTYVGTLSIDAEPGGDVFVDRRIVGHTPLRVTSLKAGSHLIWIERDGYQRWTRVVQVPADRVSRVWADMEPLTAR